MTYHKPEVVKLDAAVNLILGTAKGQPLYNDANSPFPQNAKTMLAYEADE